MTSTIVLTRQQLFEKVWTTPMINLATDFGLSDVGLRKTCHRYNIPTPPAGYWSKKQHGKAGPVPDLPAVDGESSDIIRFEPPSVPDSNGPSEERTAKQPEVAEALEKEKRAPRIEVGELGANMARFVANTYRALKAAKPSEFRESFGRLQISSESGECLNVNVGPNSVIRTMRFLNALVRALEERGFKLVCKDRSNDKYVVLTMLGEELSFHMFEPSKRKQHVLSAKERERKKENPNYDWYKKWDFDPSGLLEFKVSGHGFYCPSQTWRDTAKRPLEANLNDVIVRMLWMVDELKTKRAEHVIAEKQRVESERRRAEAEERRRKEEVRVRGLFAEMESWERSGRIRRYLVAVEESARSRHGRIETGSELDVWLQWANRVADGTDPLCATVDS